MIMVSRVLFALTALAILATSTFAADVAERRIIGFSGDGRYFAFEQFGVQDGSGFPYSEIFILDVVNDKWAAGSPFRTRIDDDTKDVNDARAATAGKAADALSSLAIHEAGRLLAANPITESGVNPHQIAFKVAAHAQEVWSLKVNDFTLNAPDCQGLGVDIKGFALILTPGTGPIREMHRDNSIPKSRKCPTGYGISDVIMHDNFNEPTKLVVLIRVMSFGFEGRDARYIAIPAVFN